MPASTADELIGDLDDGLQWRRSELHAMRTNARAIPNNEDGRPAHRAALRSCVVLLYAHWEGYTKDSCQAYLDYVARRKLTGLDVSEAFLRTSLAAVAKRATTDIDGLNVLVELARQGGAVRLPIPRKGVVETGSNLRHDVLHDVLGALGLPTSAFETRRQLIDRELCDTRNSIAHGKANFPDKETVEQLFESVIDMMTEIRDILTTAVRTSAYRSDSGSPSSADSAS